MSLWSSSPSHFQVPLLKLSLSGPEPSPAYLNTSHTQSTYMHEMANGRPHPHLSIHSRSSPSHNSSPVTDQYNFLVTPPPDSSARDPLGLWSDNYSHSSFAISSPDSAYPLDGPSYPMSDTSISGRTRSRPTSAYESSNANFPFPEPQLYRSASHRSSLRPSASRSSLGHRSTRSEVQLPASSVHRGESRPPSFIASDESSPEVCILLPSLVPPY